MSRSTKLQQRSRKNQRRKARSAFRHPNIESLEQRAMMAISVSGSFDGAINEGSSAGLQGTYSGYVGSTQTLTVAWGDGSVANYSVYSGAFSLAHTYADDDSDDQYRADFTLSDGVDTGNNYAIVTVNNVIPTISSLGAVTATEGSSLTFSRSYSDPGSLDTHRVWIDWGDGTYDDYAVSGGNFSGSHVYADDNPTGTSVDGKDIVVKLYDDDQGTRTGTLNLSLYNATPSLTLSLAQSTITEGSNAVLTGTYGDNSGSARAHHRLG